MSSIFNLYKLWSHSCMQYFYISNLYNSLYIVKTTRIEKFKIIRNSTQQPGQLGNRTRLVKVVLGQIILFNSCKNCWTSDVFLNYLEFFNSCDFDNIYIVKDLESRVY